MYCYISTFRSFRKKKWDESIDIWSLGCTFFELYYGILLFKYQGNKDGNIGIKSINSVLDWAFDGPNSERINSEYSSISFEKPNIPPEYSDQTNKIFNDLIEKMLFVDPSKRLNIDEVLSHEYFNEINTNEFENNIKPLKNINLGIKSHKICRLISLRTQKFINKQSIRKLSLDIFKNIYNLIFNEDENNIILTCIWISCKLINSSIPNFLTDEEYFAVIRLESEICNLTQCNFLK